jgi:hypothetical protein
VSVGALVKLHRGLKTLELEGNDITAAGVRTLVGEWARSFQHEAMRSQRTVVTSTLSVVMA